MEKENKQKQTTKKGGNKNKRKAVHKPLTQGVDLREWLNKNGMPEEVLEQEEL